MKFISLTGCMVILACVVNAGPARAQTAPGVMAPVPAAAKPHHAAVPKGGEFTTQAAAAAHCPHDSVEWSSLNKSRSFHASGSRYFGKTKHGAYMCKADLLAAGFHQAKS